MKYFIEFSADVLQCEQKLFSLLLKRYYLLVEKEFKDVRMGKYLDDFKLGMNIIQ
jgi:hypothetical protein